MKKFILCLAVALISASPALADRHGPGGSGGPGGPGNDRIFEVNKVTGVFSESYYCDRGNLENGRQNYHDYTIEGSFSLGENNFDVTRNEYFNTRKVKANGDYWADGKSSTLEIHAEGVLEDGYWGNLSRDGLSNLTAAVFSTRDEVLYGGLVAESISVQSFWDPL